MDLGQEKASCFVGMFTCYLFLTEYFTSSRNPHHDELLKAETRLKSDTDRDVRYFASLSPQASIEHHQTVSRPPLMWSCPTLLPLLLQHKWVNLPLYICLGIDRL